MDDKEMKKVSKSKIIFMFAIAALLSILTLSIRVPVKVVNDSDTSILVSDMTGTLTEDAVSSIRSSLLEFQSQTGITPALVIVNSNEWVDSFDDFKSFAQDTYADLFDDESHYLICYSEDSNNNLCIETVVGRDTDSILTPFWQYMIGNTLHQQMLKSGNISVAVDKTFYLITNTMNVVSVQYCMQIIKAIIICACISLLFVMAIKEILRQLCILT